MKGQVVNTQPILDLPKTNGVCGTIVRRLRSALQSLGWEWDHLNCQPSLPICQRRPIHSIRRPSLRPRNFTPPQVRLPLHFFHKRRYPADICLDQSPDQYSLSAHRIHPSIHPLCAHFTGAETSLLPHPTPFHSSPLLRLFHGYIPIDWLGTPGALLDCRLVPRLETVGCRQRPQTADRLTSQVSHFSTLGL